MHKETRLKINTRGHNMPKEVRHVVDLIKNQLSNMPDDIEQTLDIIDYARCSCWDGEWGIGSDFEDGSSTCFWDPDKEQWNYRTPWDGVDHKVPGGMLEVVSNTICLITRGAKG